jgi:hypothetical protein
MDNEIARQTNTYKFARLARSINILVASEQEDDGNIYHRWMSFLHDSSYVQNQVLEQMRERYLILLARRLKELMNHGVFSERFAKEDERGYRVIRDLLMRNTPTMLHALSYNIIFSLHKFGQAVPTHANFTQRFSRLLSLTQPPSPQPSPSNEHCRSLQYVDVDQFLSLS